MDFHEAYTNIALMQAEQSAHIEAVRELWGIGTNVEHCPYCGGPLSFDLSGKPFCRGCQKNIKRNLVERGKV